MTPAVSQDLTTRRQRPNLPRLCATFITCAGLLVASVSPATTTADWTDAEYSSANFSALTVPAPVIASCTSQRTLLSGPRVTLTWHYPSSGYTLANAQYWSGSSPAHMTLVAEGNVVPTTGPNAGTYTTTLEGGLLSGLLGGNVYIGISTVHESGWSSKNSTVYATFPAVVGQGTCE